MVYVLPSPKPCTCTAYRIHCRRRWKCNERYIEPKSIHESKNYDGNKSELWRAIEKLFFKRSMPKQWIFFVALTLLFFHSIQSAFGLSSIGAWNIFACGILCWFTFALLNNRNANGKQSMLGTKTNQIEDKHKDDFYSMWMKTNSARDKVRKRNEEKGIRFERQANTV